MDNIIISIEILLLNDLLNTGAIDKNIYEQAVQRIKSDKQTA